MRMVLQVWKDHRDAEAENASKKDQDACEDPLEPVQTAVILGVNLLLTMDALDTFNAGVIS